MAYVTVASLKTYLGITEDDHDALLAQLISAAEKVIEARTGRVFETNADTTRYFTVGVDTHGDTLVLDRDLCAITSIRTNADADDGGTELEPGDYFTRPRNDTPYFEIQLSGRSGKSWTYTYDPEGGIAVTGKWAYSVTPPADIAQACTRLAAYFYRQRDANVFDVTAIPAAGVIQTPQGIPRDVDIILSLYRRRM